MDSEGLQARLQSLEEALRTLESRVANLEREPAQTPPQREFHPTEETEAAPGIDITLIGKSVLMIGGAYVLRALTELHLLAEIAGVLLAFAYAMVWVWVADRALSRQRRTVALFDAGTAALIAGSLIWEATTRFRTLTPAFAGGMVVIASVALLFVARRRSERAVALIATGMAAVTCIGVAIGTGDLMPSILAVTVVGVIIAMQPALPAYSTLLLGVVADCLAVAFVVMTAMDKTPHAISTVESVLIAVAALWLTPTAVFRSARWPELGQTVAATLAALGGAALIAAVHGGHPIPVASACLTLSLIAYGAIRDRAQLGTTLAIAGAVAAAIGSFLLIPPPALAIAWAVAAIAVAAVGRRAAWPAMTIQAALWALGAASIAITSGASLLAISLATALALWVTPRESTPRSRLLLLGVATASAILGVLSFLPANSALIRTAILAVAAVLLSILSPYVPEGPTIARAVLVVGGMKLLFEDLRGGQATTIVIALALYGGAIVIVARRPWSLRHRGV